MTNKINSISTIPTQISKGLGLIALAVLAIVAISVPFLTHAATLERELQLGMSGSDVTALQTFLAKDRTIYPQGLITGYFGSLTKSAVSNFQARNGISNVGRVGPQTLPVINAQMNGGSGTSFDIDAPYIMNLNLSKNNNSATVTWDTSEPVRAVVYYSTNFLIQYENLHTVDISGNTASTDNGFRTSHSVNINGLQPNTLYYYLVYVTDNANNVSMSLPQTFRSN